MEHFYFDHNATTPLAPEVRDVYLRALDQVYGNPSSVHYFGQAAKRQLEQARRQVAELIHAGAAEVVFTSGGTESDNLALLGVVRAVERPSRHVVTTVIEHSAVLAACAQLERENVAVSYVRVNSQGLVDPDDVRRALRPDTVLISVMHANNEIGTVQPIAEIASIARRAGVYLHVDGVQALGKIPVDMQSLGADLYSMSGHKIYAPKGAGALYVRKGTRLAPVLFGGHHERGYRPGTENVPGAAAFGAAAELAARTLPAEAERLGALRDRLENAVLERIPGCGINGARWRRTPNTSNIYFDAVDGEALCIALDLRGFAVSTGSACSSGAVEPSHVLTALGLSPDRARACLRISLGRTTTAAAVDALIEALDEAMRHLRRLSPRAVSHG